MSDELELEDEVEAETEEELEVEAELEIEEVEAEAEVELPVEEVKESKHTPEQLALYAKLGAQSAAENEAEARERELGIWSPD